MESFHDEYGEVFKIGFTRKGTNKRLKQLQTGNPNIEIVSEYESEYAKKIETALHHTFSNKRVGGEWFVLDENDVINFISICSLLHTNFNTLHSYMNPFI